MLFTILNFFSPLYNRGFTCSVSIYNVNRNKRRTCSGFTGFTGSGKKFLKSPNLFHAGNAYHHDSPCINNYGNFYHNYLSNFIDTLSIPDVRHGKDGESEYNDLSSFIDILLPDEAHGHHDERYHNDPSTFLDTSRQKLISRQNSVLFPSNNSSIPPQARLLLVADFFVTTKGVA